ncbi:hypothetical protein LINGRAHAP2_LOCUS33231 [Linum grandiflorum]
MDRDYEKSIFFRQDNFDSNNKSSPLSTSLLDSDSGATVV